MKKVSILIALCVALLLSACNNEKREYETLLNALDYVRVMEFHNCSGMWRLSYSIMERRGHTQIIFVNSEQDFIEGDFPDNASVVWPSLYTYAMLDGMNIWLGENSEVIDINEYSFTFPLAAEDLTKNWENMRELWQSLAMHTGFHERHAFSEHNRIMSLELEILGETFEAEGIEFTKYGFELPFSYDDLLVRDLPHEFVIFRLYEKLNEDIQLQLAPKIPNVMSEFRSRQRFIEIQEAWVGEL